MIENYDPESAAFYDEMFASDGEVHNGLEPITNFLQNIGSDELLNRQQAAEQALMKAGITFTVYGEDAGTERIFPFDLIPRVITADEWSFIDRGLRQRICALNMFLDDIYNERKVLIDGIIPRDLVVNNPAYREQCIGLQPPRRLWAHIVGTDLVRDKDGTIYVLEDNLRCPSGVSYVMENRQLLRRTFPSLFQQLPIAPVDDYPARLYNTLASLSTVDDPTCVVLTPGIYNSAYYEHSFLASEMGVQLVEGNDLVVQDDYVYMRTTEGLQRVDVIYRRIDDDFLDPEVFRADSALGVPGLMRAYTAGNVAIANAPGTGVADDKAVYAYVPRLIRYYLQEEPILANVPTHICREPEACAHVLENLDKLVVKAVDGAGGYGMLMGPHASEEERQEFAKKIQEKPESYIAQPVLSLSRVPTIIEDQLEGRHVDLRPYVLCGERMYVQPGGLTRVALRKGSLVVNSSQGGGSKDTWVLRGNDHSSDSYPAVDGYTQAQQRGAL